ncbi:MAG: ATP-binding cassette domain-containing protein [Ignisphaera sp.]
MRELKALEVRNLSVYSSTKEILRNVNFSLSSGEILLVTGRSGSGKTTLLRSLIGIARELYGLSLSGSVSVYGNKISNTYEASKYFYYVPQEPWYSISFPYPAMDILFKSIDIDAKAVEEMAKRLGVSHKLFDSSINLSAGEAQRIAFLEALASKAKIILIDEITSYLDRESRRQVVEAVKLASEYGETIVVVDHDIFSWRGIANKILYIEKGIATMFDDPMETPIYEDFKALEYTIKNIERFDADTEKVIEVDNIWFKYPDSKEYILKGISFDVFSGDLIWVRGGSGRGKSTLLKILAGILKPSRGSVKRFVRGVQLVSENPLHYISNPTAGDEIGWNKEIARIAGLEDALNTPIAFLSSGERRRLAIASAFIRQPKALLIDEPTVGLDPWNSIAVIKLLTMLQQRGSAIVVASHGEELGYIATKTLVV